MRSANCRRFRGAILCAALAAVLVVPSLLEARVVRIEMELVETPTFEGHSFGDVGPYEKLVGRVFGEVDPEAPENAVITDIELAPRNANGMVEYAADLLILRPVDPAQGNGRIFYELNNRGRILSLGQLNDARSGGNDPTTAADSGNGFLMRRGYTFVSSGWDATAAPDCTRLRIAAPIAVNPDGSPIVGPALEEFVVDNDSTLTGTLAYPAASRDTRQASLTVRKRYADVPEAIDADGWEYIDARTIRLRPPGRPFEQGRLYELAYPARDPQVAGLGLAAVRDVVAFLRHAETDDEGAPNPLAGSVDHVLTMGISQAARLLRDFVHLGFNADERGRRVFDGVLNWIGGASGGFFNYRFAQPFRTHRQHIARWFPEREFPFANHLLTDPVTGRTDGRLERCRASGTCPRLMEANSANEYWVKGASLLHTDLEGNDLPDPPEVRFYLFSSLPHAAGIGSSGLGICQQPRNPLVANAGLRALLVALDDWVTTGAEPPASRVPRRADGSLTIPLPREMVGFPNIPGVRYTGLMSTGDLFDYGPDFNEGILTTLPPESAGSPYPVFVPRTDVDGNDLAGIRLPPVAAPRATFTGWALRAPAFGGPDLCDAAGQQIDFAATRDERLASGDPRPSLEERYPDPTAYVEAVAAAAQGLAREHLLLDEDVERMVREAETTAPGR
ncbi:MAG: alpha/beta hydrolase domain-containing protein [Acidobacteria bacterium]|nr:alpha/beta hydrolase domain-containing protein [Acidobacteriota bacterium]